MIPGDFGAMFMPVDELLPNLKELIFGHLGAGLAE
jgi:hypothetical protein